MAKPKQPASRKAKITDEHRAEAARLKVIYERAAPPRGPNQKEFGREHGIGGQTMVTN